MISTVFNGRTPICGEAAPLLSRKLRAASFPVKRLRLHQAQLSLARNRATTQRWEGSPIKHAAGLGRLSLRLF